MEINQKVLTKILTDQRKEYERYIGVILEDSKDQTKLLAETLLGVQQQLVSIRDMVAKNTEDIEIIKDEMYVVRTDLKGKPARDEMAILENRVAKLEKVIKTSR